MAMTGKTYVDGKDIYAGYGVYITSGGWNGLVAMPPLKTPESNDWQEEDGVEVDLTAPVLDTREFTVTFACAPDASRMADFIALLSDGAYHTFRCDWIGRTYTLRMVSQSKLSYNPALGTFSLKMADDFPLDGYTYAAPESGIPEHDDYLLDGTPMTDYGVRVLSGTLSNVLSMPDVKTALLRNVSVLAGAEYDPETVTFKSKDVKVQCLMRAGTLEGLWRNWDALLYDLVRAGQRTLFCADAGRAFPCFYKSCSVSSFSPGERPWLQFALTLTFTYDTRMDYVLFRIEPTPADAAVTINGRSVTFVMVSLGTEVEWTVEREGYRTRSGSQTVTEDTTLPVELERETYTVTFRVSPSDAAVTVNGKAYTPVNGEVSVSALWGEVLEWSVSKDGYGTRSGSLTVTGDRTVDVVLIDAGSIISDIAYDDIPAGGGTVLPRMSAVEGAVLTYSGKGVNATTGAVSADSLGTTVKARARVTMVTVTAEYGGAAVSASCEVYQQENRVERTDTVSETFGAVSVSLSYGEDIPAGGGSVTPDLEYSQTVTGRYTDTYTSGATETRSGSFTVTSGAVVTYSGATDSSTGAVSAGSLGTTVRERTLLATVAVTVTMNGETASASAGVWQEENKVESATDEETYSDVTITGGFEYDDIGAGGGSVTPTAVTYTQTHTTGHSETYTSGEVASDGTTETITSGAVVTYSGTGVDTSTGSVSADSLGTTLKDRTKITTSTATVTLNGKSASKTADVYQEENKVESESSETTYGTPSVSLSYAEDIPAGGGTVSPTLSYSQTKTTGHSLTYTSGEVKSDGTTETITSGATVTYSGSGVNTSSGSVSASSLGTTVKARTKITTATATVAMNGKSASKSADVWQEENKVESTTDEETYSDIAITGGFEYDDIGAGGGSVTPTAVTYTQTHTTGHSETYTSGEVKSDGTTETITTGAGVTYSGTGVNTSTGSVSADSLGTTLKDRTKITTSTATVTLNGKSNSVDADVYQEANEVTGTETSVTYGEVEVLEFRYEDVPASGGTVYPNVSYRQMSYDTVTSTYTSGSAQTSSTEAGYVTDGGTPDFYDGADDEATGAVTAPSLGTEERERTCVTTVFMHVTGKGGMVSGTYTADVYQEANEVVSSTAEYTDEILAISSFTYPDIPAGGGTVYPSYDIYHIYDLYVVYTYTSGAQDRELDGDKDVAVTPDELRFADNTLKLSPITLDTATGAATAGAATSTERQSLTTVTATAYYTSPETGEELVGSATAGVWQEAREVWLRVDPDSLTFGADGGERQADVDSSADWWVEDVDGDWLTATPRLKAWDVVVAVTADANTSVTVRGGSVTLANEDGCTAEMAVEQEAGSGVVNHTLTVNISLFSIAQQGGTTLPPMLRLTCGGVTETLILTGSTGATEWSWSGEYEHGSVVEYEVSMDGYTTVTGSVTMDSDKEVNVTLREGSSGGGLLG